MIDKLDPQTWAEGAVQVIALSIKQGMVKRNLTGHIELYINTTLAEEAGLKIGHVLGGYPITRIERDCQTEIRRLWVAGYCIASDGQSYGLAFANEHCWGE